MQRDRATAVCCAYVRKVHSAVVHMLFMDLYILDPWPGTLHTAAKSLSMTLF